MNPSYYEYIEAEAAEERYQAEQDRRDRHMPVILESDDVTTEQLKPKGVKMRSILKPMMKDGKLTAALYKAEITRLMQVAEIGDLLTELHLPEGEDLVKAVDAVLAKFTGERPE